MAIYFKYVEGYMRRNNIIYKSYWSKVNTRGIYFQYILYTINVILIEVLEIRKAASPLYYIYFQDRFFILEKCNEISYHL